MSKLSKFFCVAVAGATCDGRTIDGKLIDEMAASYDRATYGARVNMEHIRGFSADPPFNAYGDVAALEARTIDLNIGGKVEKRRALFAQVEGLDTLVALSEKKQKIYPSIEINPNFADTGKAYLQGLAVTDSPASLGTEVLEFAAKQGDKSFLSSRKVQAGNFFSSTEGDGVVIEFEDGEAPASAAGMFAAVTTFFQNLGKGNFGATEAPKQEEKPAAPADAGAGDLTQLSAAIGQGFEKLSAAMVAQGKELGGKITALRTDHDALKASIETTDGGGAHRPLAPGGDTNFARTDC